MPANSPLNYIIRFENDPVLANAPAQVVKIIQTLDPDLDPRSFRIGGFGFGGMSFAVPENRAFYSTRLDLLALYGIYLDVIAYVDVATAQIVWEFTSIDPATGDVPVDRFVGFLPPNVTAPQGDGYVTYTVRPRSTAPHGARLDAEARIFFDANAPIDTPPIFNTLDALAPQSAVTALPPIQTEPRFRVRWSGDDWDTGSGLASYTVYVSDNGGEFRVWQENVTFAEADFLGEFGHTYSFYSVSTDRVGLRQAIPATAQTTTQLVDPRGVSIGVTSSLPGGSTYGQAVTFTATVTQLLGTNPTPTGTVQFRVDGVNFGSPVALVNGVAAVTTTLLNAGNRVVTAVYTSDAGNYDPSTSAAVTQVVAKATLTVTADNKTKVAGAAFPTFTATYTGFVNGEGSGVLSGVPELSAPAAALNTAGTYAITAAAGTLAAANYTFAFVNGTLTVTPANPATIITVAGTPQTVIVGGVTPVAFRVVVRDAYGNAVPGETVTFMAPATGATGTFAGSATATAVTDANGEATAPAFTANFVTGGYTVVANVMTPLADATFTLTNRGPQVQAVRVNDGPAQRSRVTSLTVTFDSAVTVLPGAFVLTGVGPTGTLLTGTVVSFTTQTVNGVTVATLTFNGPNTNFGSLADGRWVLTVDRTLVSLGGVQMEANYSSSAAGVSIHRLFGDTDGDADVDAADNLRFRLAFGSLFGQTAYRADLDFDGDGDIDALDNLRFRQRFGTVLPP